MHDKVSERGVELIQTEPVVCISDGCLRGTVLQNSVGSSYPAFLGIPFAKPPIGKLRFANPQPNDPWQGKYNASTTKSACIQIVTVLPSSRLYGSEDCLYLNVFMPTLQILEDALLPVMVYIQGGGFLYGSAQLEQRNPARFMTWRRVIVVTFQYRLGVFGFLSTGDRSAPGNFGMKDQVMVLRWVKKNIRAFGGDPNRVTIFGESVGGSSVQYQMLSPLSRGLFHRAVSMGGSDFNSLKGAISSPLAFLFSEAYFQYPMVKNIKQHLANRKNTSTSVYSFQFRGRYSFSKLLTGSEKSYGISLLDEMIYLFRMPLFFPEFPPGSPEAEMTQLWVKFIVDFATQESVDKIGTCYGEKCDVVTIDEGRMRPAGRQFDIPDLEH
ncbi:putative inactive carboxylesterase 4 [Anopheles gambiae]|uniref:putative inactive carboxylesterase 4 n=1 Tax=Anopheles gambiae TaxID=7165 RepID=UPI002AC92A3D|nr:putative inactive carboxylesterase 4 [Anopheles gambiae]